MKIVHGPYDLEMSVVCLTLKGTHTDTVGKVTNLYSPVAPKLLSQDEMECTFLLRHLKDR